MYKVFAVEGGWEIFWCPTEYEKIALNSPKVYSTRPAAYRRVKQLNDALKGKKAAERKSEESVA